VGKIPISTSRSYNKLAHSNGNLTIPLINKIIPEKSKEIQAEAPFYSYIPINAGVWTAMALRNCA
jgi:hypothetical protein